MTMKLIVCALALLGADLSDQAGKATQDSSATRPAGTETQEAADAATTDQAPQTPAPAAKSTTDDSADPAQQPQNKAAPGTQDAVPKTQTSEDQQDDLLPIEANIVSYTNRERERYGLPPLKVDRRLMRSARRHCAWMARNRSLVHTSQPVAENIAMGQSHSSEAVRDWMNSSGHRANILNRGHRRIGVAAYRTPSGRIFWCQQFGR